MRRFILFITCATMVLCLTSCLHNDKTNRALICGYSDSVPEIVPKLDYVEWSKGAYFDQNQPQTVKGSVDGIDFSGTYFESEMNYGTYEIRHSYLDDNKKIFEINDEGVLSAYFWGSDNSINGEKSQIECQSIALNFIFGVFGSYPSDCEEKISYDEESKMYTFEYIKLIRGVESEERIDIVVEASGHIYSYRSTLWGKIHEEQVPYFDLEDAQKDVTKRLDELTKTARDSYSQVEYKDYDYRVSMIAESKYAILCTVDVICINRNGEFDVLAGEIIRFVIPL